MLSWALIPMILKRIGAWLASLSFWQVIALGLALFAGIQTMRVWAEQRHSAKVEAQLAKAVQQLRDISTRRNEQKAETNKRIIVVREKIRHADDEARKIEQAPLPGQCRTPDAVLQADL